MSDLARRRWYYGLVLFAVLYLTCFHRLGAVGIFDLDEGLYSTASRQMLESRDFIVPRIGKEVRFAKPPLIYWLQVPSLALFGFTPFAVRLPSALCIAATALLLWLHGALAGRSRAGWLAALIFLGSPLALVLARQGITDALLSLCLTVTVFGWCRGAEGNSAHSRLTGWMLMAAGMGLAALCKGLLGLLLPGLALVLWLLWRGNKSGTGLREVPWLPMLAVTLIIALPWHWLMYRALGQQFVDEYFLSNQIKRFQGRQWGHVQPFWFYIPVLAVGMFPWSALIPSACRQALADWKRRDPLRVDIWLLWAAVVFLFFSVSKSKLPGYLLPVLPPMALLIGARLDTWCERRQGLTVLETAPLCVVPFLLGGVGLVAGVLGWQWMGAKTATLFGKNINHGAMETVVLLIPWLLVLGAVLMAAAVVLPAVRRNPRWVSACLLAINGVMYLVAIHGGLTVYDREQIAPLHQLARTAIPALARGEKLAIYALRPRRPSLRFVLGHTAQVTEIENPEPEKLRAAVNGSQGYILAMRDAPLPALPVHIDKQSTSRRWVLYRWSRH